MFSKIKAFFVTVEHDVEAIVADFTNTVTKLENAVEAKIKQADIHAAEAAIARAAEGAARDAAKRAYDVAAKIKDLVS
jgi:hypothetical protein